MRYVFAPPQHPAVRIVGSTGWFPVHRVYCVGRNYADHAQEMGGTGREPPFFFMKPADAVLSVGEGETGVLRYPALTRELHHEVELVVALREGGANLSPADAERCIYGYAVGLDMTRRDLQNEMKKAGRPWEIAKSFDRSAPVGGITPASWIEDISKVEITLDVNGVRRQHGRVRDLIWKIPEVIGHLSAAWELKPGDLIFTGTPAGVGPVGLADLMTANGTELAELRVRVMRA
ncbi:MAG TPA: fumarylacetoacetate hydrolase family protein [Steroidobacteraceae bacterium]|nr:fumarylacetoacetate hydrolase family protein [Steroidobacteraceae bacterium]